MRRAAIAAILLMPTSSCTPPAQQREDRMVEECEHYLLTFKVKTPASYKRIDVVVGIPDEKKHRQTVFIQYDAVNEYNAPLRQLQQCDFPYGPTEAKLRPITDIERNVVAETEKEAPDPVELDVPSDPDCCMPAPVSNE